MKTICSQMLLLTAVSVSVFYGAHGFHNFRQPQDLFYLNFFDDDVLEQDTPIGYKVPVEEIEFTSVNEEKTTKPQEEVDLLIKDKVKFVKDKNDFTEAKPTTSRLKELFTTSNTNTWDIKTKTNEKVFFQTDLYGPVIDIQTPPKLPTPEPCPNSIADRFTRVYLKTITNLIQHILDALFGTNLTTGPKLDTEVNDIPVFDSKPLRQIKKRDISKRDTENLVNIEDQSNTYNTKEITQTTEEVTSNSKQSTTNIIIKDSIASKFPENKLLREENEIVSATSGSSKLTETSEQLSTNDIMLDVSASSHSTMVSEHPATVTDKEAASSTTVVSNYKKEPIRILPPKDVISIDDLINDEGTVLNSLKITSKELHDVDPHPEYKNHNLVQHPLAGDNNKNLEGSTGGVVMVVTGTILVVLILVSIGAAVAYAFQKKYLGRLQTGNQNSSNQRAAMA